jgi:uncharacterized phage protein (TIGR02218 family)
MSSTISVALKAHLATSPTSLCRLIAITRKDGVVKRFTDHDVAITYDGQVYDPEDGVQFASVYSSVGQGIQNTSLTVIFSDTLISEVDVVRGVYDAAGVVISVVNWADLTQDRIIRLTGTVSVIGNSHKGYGVFEVKGLLNRSNRIFGDVYQPECRADLGDAKCTVDIEALSQTFTVTVATSSSIFTGTVPVARELGYHALGVLTWLTGDNAGYSMEIMQDNSAIVTRTINLVLPMPFTIQVGDTAKIYPGCDKIIGTCFAKFANNINFRGEPPMRGAGFV